MLKNDLDGLAPYPFQENFHSHNLKAVTTWVWEEAYLQGLDDDVGLTLEEWNRAFMILEEECPENLKKFIHKAFKARTVFFGTIFTFKKDLFLEFSRTLLRALLRMTQQLSYSNRLQALNYRFGGYLLERLSSCLIWAYKLSGKKITHMPLMLCDAENNPPRQLTTADSGLACMVGGIQRLLDQLSEKKSQSIKVFACDHRKNISWELPFIRLGNFQSDAELKIDSDLSTQLMLSEGAQLLWIREHYAELGDPDYVGLCHYRRFFASGPNALLFDFDKSKISEILTPAQQLDLFNNQHFDGISVGPYVESFLSEKLTDKKIAINQIKFSSISEYFHTQFKYQGLNMTLDEVSDAVNILYECCPDWLKHHLLKAMSSCLIRFANMFTLRRDLFFILADTIKASVDRLVQKLGDERCKALHCRELGYVVERYTSLMLDAFALSGARIYPRPIIQFEFKETVNKTSCDTELTITRKPVGEILKLVKERGFSNA